VLMNEDQNQSYAITIRQLVQYCVKWLFVSLELSVGLMVRS
jgi:hypothetical protein